METSHVIKVGGTAYKQALKLVYEARIKNKRLSIKEAFEIAMDRFSNSNE